MGPGGQWEESELTCGPGLSARGGNACGATRAAAGRQLHELGCCAVRGRASWAGGVLAGLESTACGRRGELGRGAGSAGEKGGENGLGRFGLRLSLGWRRKEVAGWAAHGFGAGLAVGLV